MILSSIEFLRGSGLNTDTYFYDFGVEKATKDMPKI